MLAAVQDALASFSSTVDWPAWEAVGTVGALWYAVIAGSQTARTNRLRADGLLKAFIGVVEPLRDSYYELSMEDKNLSIIDQVYELRQRSDELEDAASRLLSFPEADVASVGSSEYRNGLVLALKYMKEALERPLETWASENGHLNVEYFNDMADYLDESLQYFSRMRDRLRWGVVGVWLAPPARRIWIGLLYDREVPTWLLEMLDPMTPKWRGGTRH
jgi:hypothetical protein